MIETGRFVAGHSPYYALGTEVEAGSWPTGPHHYATRPQDATPAQVWLEGGQATVPQGPTSPALAWLNFGLPDDVARDSGTAVGRSGPFGQALFPTVHSPLHLQAQSNSPQRYFSVLATDVHPYDLDTCSPKSLTVDQMYRKMSQDKDPRAAPADTGPPAKPFRVDVSVPGGHSPSLTVLDRTTIVWNVASQKASSSDHMAVSPPFRLSEGSPGDFVFVLVAVPGSARTTPSFKRSRGRVRVQLKSRASGDEEILGGFLSFRMSVGASSQCRAAGTEMTHSFASNALCECPTVFDLSALATPGCPIPIRLELPSH